MRGKCWGWLVGRRVARARRGGRPGLSGAVAGSGQHGQACRVGGSVRGRARLVGRRGWGLSRVGGRLDRRWEGREESCHGRGCRSGVGGVACRGGLGSRAGAARSAGVTVRLVSCGWGESTRKVGVGRPEQGSRAGDRAVWGSHGLSGRAASCRRRPWLGQPRVVGRVEAVRTTRVVGRCGAFQIRLVVRHGLGGGAFAGSRRVDRRGGCVRDCVRSVRADRRGWHSRWPGESGGPVSAWDGMSSGPTCDGVSCGSR